MTQTENMYRELGISPAVYAFGQEIEKGLKERFDRIDETAEYNQLKVVGAMQKNRVEAACFAATSGYGYNDLGRETLEAVYILKRDTRHFAKRQITWFKRERDVRWLELEQFQNDRKKVLEHILDEIEGEGIR